MACLQGAAARVARKSAERSSSRLPSPPLRATAPGARVLVRHASLGSALPGPAGPRRRRATRPGAQRRLPQGMMQTKHDDAMLARHTTLHTAYLYSPIAYFTLDCTTTYAAHMVCHGTLSKRLALDVGQPPCLNSPPALSKSSDGLNLARDVSHLVKNLGWYPGIAQD